jgi:hypothetical protein
VQAPAWMTTPPADEQLRTLGRAIRRMRRERRIGVTLSDVARAYDEPPPER